MNWWVYKCNSQNRDYQNSYGDWKEVFGKISSSEWGNSKLLPKLSQLKKRDKIIAYQTDRNELAGVAEVVKSCGKNGELRLKPIEAVWKKVRELKEINTRVADIQAFKAGPIQTIYKISESEVRQLLKTAKAKYRLDKKDLESSLIAPSVIEPPKRVSYEISRIVRDTAKTLKLKKLYESLCQICQQRIEINPVSFYCEVHHIKPLGGKHRGLDVEENMIVVCPTHHAYFDIGVAKFVSNNKVKIGKEIHTLSSKHKISKSNLDYHNKEIFGSNV